MILILTEKPSVAKEIATVLNGQQQDGHYTCSNQNFLNSEVIVTYAFGHLLQIANEIPKPWSVDNLPLFPNFEYKANESGRKQLATINKLIQKVDKVFIATDCGREGELIARLILNHCKWSKWNDTFRFWTSEFLNETVIKRELINAAPSSKYDGLYKSSLARQHADWIVGINLTVATSVCAGGNYSVGRVQTPVLKLISVRDNEINNFVSKNYYTIEGTFNQNENYIGKFIQDDAEDLYSEETAQSFIDDLNNHEKSSVIDVVKKNEEKLPPLLHSLTTLQQEANEIYGFSASKTLELAQELYEKKKCISYPRSDSNYLSEGSVGMVTDMISKLNLKIDVAPDKIGKRLFDDSKLTDHYALIPLDNLSNGSEDQTKLYNLILRKFHGAFLNNYIVEKTTITTEISCASNNYKFKTVGNFDVQIGWKALYKSDEKEEKSADNEIPKIEIGSVNVISFNSISKNTQPPKHYTESTLLNKMEKLGLGQPATRADIIEKIIKRDYVGRNKKNLICLDKGQELINQIGERDFSDPELTAIWDQKLTAIASNGLDYQSFIEETKTFISKEIENVSKKKFEPVKKPLPPKMLALAKSLAAKNSVKLTADNFDDLKAFIDKYISVQPEIGNCSCGKAIKESLKAFSCECGRIIWKESMGRTFSLKEACLLLEGKSIKAENFKSKDGKKYSATIVLKDRIEFVK